MSKLRVFCCVCFWCFFKTLGTTTLTASPATNFYPIHVVSSPILIICRYLLDAPFTFVGFAWKYRKVGLGAKMPQAIF
jgi:hypothetical protein